MIKTGIIKGIRRMSGGRNAFTLKNEQIDEKDVWFNGFDFAAEKGDEIEFELTIQDNFNNFSKVRVLSRAAPEIPPSSPTPPSPPPTDIQSAIELILTSPVKDVLLAFRAAQNKLNIKGEE